MKLIYLFSDTENKQEISDYTYTPTKAIKAFEAIDLHKEIREFDDSSVWILSFTTQKDTLEAAQHLSYINDDIIRFNPKVLHNESASHFNKAIFPKINDFERKLRHLLYLKCSLYNDNVDDKSKVVLAELEKEDLGKVYELLFADKQMINMFRKKVNEKNSSKLYYQKILNDLSENSIWNIVIGNNSDDFIKQHFLDIIDYRNDTMHAHNISYADYLKQKNTFEKAIDFIDSEINKIISNPVSAEATETTVNTLYNGILNQRLDNIIPKRPFISPLDSQWMALLKQELYPRENVLQYQYEDILKELPEEVISHENINEHITKALESYTKSKKEENSDDGKNKDKK
ncbi:hypothetical protein SAMN02910353_00702 [Ruminococcus sp. YRD2003]|uniref:hypothetical protein n=1 Tax=Ruminococcus sp. YRD2003 TaxID=1452313 RepID=UPI0008C3C2CA|nr:hypothetical protein SAMN02910353_00702 [Ruminococcus flavefaciens]